MRLRTTLTAGCVALAVLVAPLSCTSHTTEPTLPAAAPSDHVESRSSHGGITLTLSATPARCEVGQTISLVATIARDEALAGTDQERMPLLPEALIDAIGTELGDFFVEPVAPPAIFGNTLVARYALTTYASGDVPIPPIVVQIGETTLRTEPLQLTVTSLLADDELDPAAYRDIKPSLDLARPASRWPWIVAATVATIVVGAGLWAFVAIRRRPAVAPSPDAVALAAIATLEREELPKAARVHEFHVRLTDIVRHYIEQRFAIRAPELTTPEFLREAKRSTAIRDDDQQTLATLLRSADMVKFAGARPDPRSCDESLMTARRFVQSSAQSADHARAEARS